MGYGLGIIGNCSYSALLRDGSVEWMCWPRLDSSFVFGPLLDREKGGAFVVEGVDKRAEVVLVKLESKVKDASTARLDQIQLSQVNRAIGKKSADKIAEWVMPRVSPK